MKTYLFSGCSGYDWSFFREILHTHGYSPYPDGKYVHDGELLLKDGPCNIPYVDFLVSEWNVDIGRYDPNTYGIKSDWHSLHLLSTVDNLRRKDLLHECLAHTPFIAKTVALEDFQYNGGVYILRPSSIMANSGIDILVAYDEESFAAAKEFYTAKISAHSKYHNKSLKYYRVIVSEYITKPMLFEGRKFHLRLYGLSISGDGKFSIAKHGKIITATAPFVLDDYNNKAIHDTHFKGAERDLTFPDDYPSDPNPVYEQLAELEVELSKLSNPLPQPSAKRSFHIFGLDVMVDVAGKIYLLEVNARPGFGCVKKDQKCAELCKRHAQWLSSHLFYALQ
jgi:hypothetical protein